MAVMGNDWHLCHTLCEPSVLQQLGRGVWNKKKVRGCWRDNPQEHEIHKRYDTSLKRPACPVESYLYDG